MTGEMFALLAGQSVLRHSIADGGWTTMPYAMSQTMARPEGLAARLFSLRAAQLVHNGYNHAAPACLVC
jgi:2-dehydro-3-deoxygalactonokinase